MGEFEVTHAIQTVAGPADRNSDQVARVDTVIVMELPYNPIEMLRTDGAAFIELIAANDPITNVKACPGWKLIDLARHQGEAWQFWNRIVSDGITDRAKLREIADGGEADLDGDDLISWLRATHDTLCSTLANAKADTKVWTWTGANQPVSWVQRRMAQEAAVHRVDAADATGDGFEVPADVAADGIDEFLTWFAGRERIEGEMKPGGTVHLHCTDTEAGQGEWYIANLKEPSCTFTREHRKGDVAVRGRAHDLLMWIWRRPGGDVEVIGKDTVARRFRAYTDLD